MHTLIHLNRVIEVINDNGDKVNRDRRDLVSQSKSSFFGRSKHGSMAQISALWTFFKTEDIAMFHFQDSRNCEFQFLFMSYKCVMFYTLKGVKLDQIIVYPFSIAYGV